MFIRQKIRRLFSTGGAVFHDAQGEVVPFAAAAQEFWSIRAHLLSHARPGDIVGINLPYGYRYLLSILACMDIGIPYLPLRPSWPATRIDQIQALSGCAVILGEDDIQAALCSNAPPSAQAFDVTADAPLYVIYTSGTTGAPKGVVIPRRAYENFMRWIGAEIRLRPGCKLLFTAHFTFDVSLHDIAHLLMHDCSCFFSQFEGNLFHLAYEIEAFGIESIATVPNNINLLLQDAIFERSDLRSLRHILLAGSRFMAGAYRNILNRLPGVQDLYNLYGPTEATVYCLFKKLAGDEGHEVVDANVSIGTPAPGLKAILVDADGAVIRKTFERGELLVGGAQIMTGYLGDPERTSQSFAVVDGAIYYRTGDVAFLDGKGDYYVSGRKDDTLKRRGFRVNLLDIDAYIQKIDAVQDCVTIAVADADMDHVLATYVVARRPVMEAELRNEMTKYLLDYQLPDYIFLVDGFPTNNSGKVDKEALRGRFLVGQLKAS